MARGPSASEEFSRLIRAVNDSLERESELQRQLRRTKDSLVNVALRLQVAIKITQEDEATIAQLQNETTELRTNAIVSRKQADEASELAGALNIQILTLKRKIKALEENKAASTPKPNDLADMEVDAMLGEGLEMYEIPPNTAKGLDMLSPSPFERWKMQEFLYSADTPAASAGHDSHVVNMLVRAATSEMGKKGVDRPTQIFLGKTQLPRSPNKSLPALDRSKSGGYFLGVEKTNWGDKEGFESNNMARHNMWISGSQSAKEQLASNTAANKKELKSIRVPGTAKPPRSPATYS